MKRRYILEDLSDIRTLQEPNRSGNENYPLIGPIEINLRDLVLKSSSDEVDIGPFTFKTFLERLAAAAQIKIKVS